MNGRASQTPEWQIFNRVPGAQAIADSLKDIPADWSLTPIQDKQPKRDGWQDEPFIPHNVIASLILQGERKNSKSTGKQYTAYYSGFGLRTGEQSGGLVAIDIDGVSAEPLLQRMSGGDLPLTPGWTSGKPGRKQIVFQVPDEIRPLIANFGRAVITEFEDLKTAEGELLEFRYSNHQSCLPPSRHPQTGKYKWTDSPADVPVAIAPPWLCAKLIEFANQEYQDKERKQQQTEERLRQTEERRRQRQLNTIGVASLEDVLEESRKRLHAEDIYNWPGHNWHYRGKTQQGCCPRHQSTSGKSFHVNTETLEWFCFGCNVGGDLVQYRYFAQGGNGTPKGRDFVEVLRGLASDAGVQMPELSKSERDHNWDEPDADTYAEYVAQQEEQERIDECAAAFERERRERDRLPQLHPDTIEEIKQQADANIVDVIGQRVNLTKRGKDFFGCCPFHNDGAFSFSVSSDKQLYQCLGCGVSGSAIQFLMQLNKRSFSDTVLELAQHYQMPVRSANGTAISADTLRDAVGGSVSNHRTISPDEWELKFGLPNWFRGQLNRLGKIFKGFGTKPPQTPTSKPEPQKPKPQPKIYYTPGKLPSRENYKKIGCPKIRFAPGERLQLIAELVGLGYHDILDSSATGTSKSHDAGLAEPERLGVDRLWYFAQDHRNPTTHTVEANYTDMPVRTGGMVEDFTRRTALDKPHIRWPQRDETPTTQGNCFRSPLFHILAEKGYQDAEIEAKINPICGSCHMKDSCAAKREAMPMPGASFRNDRREAITFSDRLRASINSSLAPKDLRPKIKTSEEGEDIVSNRNAAFIDEAMRQLAPTTIVEACLSDFDQMFAEIESKLPDVHAALKPLRLALRPILAGEIAPTKETYHGWNDAALRGVLREFRESLFDPESKSDILPEIIAQLKSIQPDLSEILQDPDSFSKAGISAKDRKDVSNETSKFIRSRVRQNSYREMADNLRALASNWLIPFLEVYCGLQRGALRIDYGMLGVTTRSTRHAEICKAMQWVVYLDATADRQYLALYLDINPSEIVHIEQEPARVENLTIVQVTGFGLAGHERSDSFNQRIDAFLRGVSERHSESNISGLDHKEHAAPRGWGWWHNDNRGSNKYLLSLVLVSFGTPYQNIGSLQDLWLVLTGDRNVSRDAPGFSEFVKWQTQSEIAQAAGRLRANLRPNEKLTYYYCSDFDLNFLENYYPGSIIKQESAFSIAPEAGTETEQSHWRIQQNILDYAKQTGTALEKLTQVTAARVSGVSQGRISQVAAHFGGWGAFKKLLALLLETPYRTTNNFEPLDEDHQFIANTYCPEVAEGDPPDTVEVMLTVARVYGWRIFQAILAATSLETRGRLLAALIGGLPPALIHEFRAIALLAPG